MKYLPAFFQVATCGEDEEMRQGKPNRLTLPTFHWEHPKMRTFFLSCGCAYFLVKRNTSIFI